MGDINGFIIRNEYLHLCCFGSLDGVVENPLKGERVREVFESAFMMSALPCFSYRRDNFL